MQDDQSNQQPVHGPTFGKVRSWHPRHLPWYVVAVAALVIGGGAGTWYQRSSNDAARSNQSESTASLPTIGATATDVNTVQSVVNPAEIEGRIGVIGCSNTRQHAMGYSDSSNSDTLWYENVDTNGGSLEAWYNQIGNVKGYWGYFTESVNSLGAEALWFQICMREQETSESGMTSEQQSRVTAVIEEARRIVGSDVDVYISPLNFYSENTCSATGPYGVSNSAELADWAAATGLAYRGPDTGPLDSSMLVADQCHLNGSGMDFVGQQMVSFFDNGNVVILPPDPDPDPDPTPDPDPVPDPKPNPDPVPTPDPDPSGKPTANFSYTPTTVTAGQPVHLTDQSVDDGLIVKLRWLISDGSVYYDQNPTHTFAKSGTYKVKFQVIDNDGNRATVVKTVVVQ